jgi:hypothetical protein
VTICAVCCGTKREVEIDCPGSCPHLQAGRSYEAEKRVPDTHLLARIQDFDEDFLTRYSPILDTLSQTVAEEYVQSPWLVDPDVVEVYKALAATMRTLVSGIHYESLPEGAVRMALFRRLKAAIDDLMLPDLQSGRDALRPSEAVDVLDFLTVAVTANSSLRPKSRQYLDWLAKMAGVAPVGYERSRLIVP